MATALLIAMSFLSLIGSATLLAVIFTWRTVATIYSSAWSKLVIAIARSVSGGTAVVVKLQTTSESQLHYAQAAAIGCYFIWEVVGIVGDQKARVTEVAVQELRRQGLSRTRLLSALSGLANIKSERIRGAFRSNLANGMARARLAFNPDTHSAVILEHLAMFLHNQLPNSEQHARPSSELVFRSLARLP